MILAGLVIAVGVVVDDAIIDVENIWRRLRQRGDGTGRFAPRVILEASLEVRTAIFYATLINVLAVVPVFFLTERDRLVLRAARPLLFAGDTGVDGGRADGDAGAELAPAVQDARASRCPARASAEARLPRAPGAGRPQAVARDRRCGTGRARRPRGHAGVRARSVSDVQGAGPLCRLGDPARHVRLRREANRDQGQQGLPGGSGRRKLRCPHRTGFPGGGSGGPELRRELVQHRQERRLRQDDQCARGRGGRLSRRLQRAADLSERADRRGAGGVDRADRRAHLRVGPEIATPPGEPGEGRTRGRTRPRRAEYGAPERRSPGGGGGKPGRRAALWAQAGRRPAGDFGARVQRGSGRHLQWRKGVRRARLEHPQVAPQPDRYPQSSDRHAEWLARALGRRGRCAHQADDQHHQTRKQLASHRRERGCRPTTAASAKRWRASGTGSRTSTSPPGLTRS